MKGFSQAQWQGSGRHQPQTRWNPPASRLALSLASSKQLQGCRSPPSS